MRAWLDADPIHKTKGRTYPLADWGLTAADLDPVFAEYQTQYGIAVEGQRD